MDLFTLAAKLQLDSKGFNSGIKNAEGIGSKFAQRMEKTLKRLQRLATAVASGYVVKKMTDALIKPAVNAYATYQQLVGGVDTLFKQASVFVQQDAATAFKDAGISANKYMEMATSFAASLVNSLDGDTVAAAASAKRAIIDMSDNANKMGTDIESIQNAYRGFSKQNYTMLDNLKLGYGGTKTEMERLLKDAEKLTGRKFNISNFADIVDAIHAIQENMGITGTTADEAATTITGSFGMVKASWEDLLVAMADPKGNVKQATQNFIESGKTMLRNVLPTIKQAISGLGEFLAEVAPMIGEELPKMIIEFLPQFLKAGKNLATGLWKGIKSAWKKINWGQLGTGIKATLGDMLGIKPENVNFLSVVEAGVEKVHHFITNVADWGRVKLADALGLDDTADWLQIAIKGVGKVWNYVMHIANWGKVKLAKRLGLDDTATWADIVEEGAKKIRTKIAEGLDLGRIELGKLLGIDDATDAEWGDIAGKIVEKLGEAIKGVGGIVNSLIDSIDAFFRDPQSMDRIKSSLQSILTGVGNALPGLGDNLGETAGNLVKGILTMATGAIQAAGEFIADPKTWEGLGNLVLGAIEGVGEFFYDGLVFPVMEWFKSIFEPVGTELASWFGSKWDEFNTNVVQPITTFLDTNIITPLKQIFEPISRVITYIYNAVAKIAGGDPVYFENVSKARQVSRSFDLAYAQGNLDEYVKKTYGDNEATKNVLEAYKAAAEEAKKFGKTVTDYMEAWERGGANLESWDSLFFPLFENITDDQFVETIKAANEEAQAYLRENPLTVNVVPGFMGNIMSMINSAAGEDGSDAKGAWNIPYDNFRARLHRGEMVLTASQARRYRDGEGFGGTGEIVSAIQGLRADMQNLRLMVGEKEFGRATVQYGGRRMQGQIGRAESQSAAGYGW